MWSMAVEFVDLRGVRVVSWGQSMPWQCGIVTLVMATKQKAMYNFKLNAGEGRRTDQLGALSGCG